MYFNYRLIATKDEDGNNLLQLYEVYYEDDGSIAGWDGKPIELKGEIFDEIHTKVGWAVEALQKPILVEKDGQLVEYGQVVSGRADDIGIAD